MGQIYPIYSKGDGELLELYLQTHDGAGVRAVIITVIEALFLKVNALFWNNIHVHANTHFVFGRIPYTYHHKQL